jgi:WD40 repeat protein
VVNAAAFSGHGRLAFVSRGALWVVDGVAGKARAVRMPRGVAAETPAVSPDGRFLAYVTTHPGERLQLWIANGDGTGARRVRGVPGSTIVGWSPRRDLLAVIAGPVRTRRPCPCFSPTTLRLVRPDRTSRRLASGAAIGGAAWAPDGTAIAAAVQTPTVATIRTYPIDGGAPTTWLSRSPPDVVRQVVGWWRRGIGFWRFGNGAVHDNDATRLEVVASPRARPRLLAWTLSDGVTRTVSASGDRLAIVTDSKRAGRVYWQDKRVVVCGGGPACAPVRTPPSRVTVDAAWSPDGHVLAFVEAPNLSFPGWPQRLLQRWYAAHRVSLLDASTGRVRSVARTSGATVPVWSADGRSLLYVARDGLWLLPTLSSDPVEIAAPLFPRRTWPAYYGQVAWSAQFAWWSPR